MASLLETILAGLSREQLESLLLRLATQGQEFADVILTEAQALVPKATAVPATPPAAAVSPTLPVPPDAASIRSQVDTAFGSVRWSRRHGGYGAMIAVERALNPLLDRVQPYLEAGDGRSALAILAPLTQEFMARWEAVVGEWEIEEVTFFDAVGTLWTEAILSAELTAAERHTWETRLRHWQEENEAESYGDVAFGAAIDALKQGWDAPALQRVLRGERASEESEEEEEPGYPNALAEAQLNVLSRQNRQQEFLRLAAASGRSARYAITLINLGRIPEAVENSLSALRTTDDALVVANALRAHGAGQDAFRVAEHGLSLEGQQVTLTHWLRDEAAAAGMGERAMATAREIFRKQPSLEDYQAIAKLAGADWPTLREEVLEELRQTPSIFRSTRVEIFLSEGRVADAIAMIQPTDYYTVVQPVVDAALPTHPEWCIGACRAQAEDIMDRGQAKYYPYAAEWLQKAREAYRLAGREPEWRAYLDQLLRQHARKSSLIPKLQRLR